MAYSTPSTRATGYVVLATNWNELVNNFLAGSNEAFTTDGDMWVATGAEAGERVAVMDASNLIKHEVGGWELDISALTTNDAVGGASSGVAEIKTPVTQAEAEAGTGTRFSLWSPQRWKQALDALAGGALTRQGGQTTEATTTSTSSTDLLTVASLSIGVTLPMMVWVAARKTTGAANNAGVGLKLNSTVIGDASTAAARVAQFDTANAIQSMSGLVWVPHRVTLYDGKGCGLGLTGAQAETGSSRGSQPTSDPVPLATITDVIWRGISTASITLGADEGHVYSYAAA